MFTPIHIEITQPIAELLLKMADDQLIIGHRNAEWTGVGPILEEDIAFASMAQDKVGQSRALYDLLYQMGYPEPDQLAFMRQAEAMRCSHLVELPVGEYDFSLVRHFLFDMAELIRFDALRGSSYAPLAQIAKKYYGEIKYHVMHGKTWMKQLGNSTDEAMLRMQGSLAYAMPFALGIFETSPFEQAIMDEGLFVGEEAIKEIWLDQVADVLASTQLEMPDISVLMPSMGGRMGNHTPHLQPLLNEMTEVYRMDPSAEW